MIPPNAILRFSSIQKKLLRQTYDQAWQEGVSSYQPDADPAPQDVPAQDRDAALAGLTGAALLAARRLYPYSPPSSPDPLRRAVALAPSYAGVNSMVGELAALPPPDAATMAAEGIASATDAFARALQDWAESNAYRLDGGDSVAWAAENLGYAEAADQDGQLLSWELDESANHCSDCPVLADMVLPLSEWPCMPGDGGTECDVGCKCDLVAIDVSIQPGDTYAPQLSPDQEATVGKLMDAQQAALASQMPDAAYLD